MAPRSVLWLPLAAAALLALTGCPPEAPPPPPPPAQPPPPPPVVAPPPVVDSGPEDAGPPDAGPEDAGPPDAGPVDAGPVDAGARVVDAGAAAIAAPVAKGEVLAASADAALQKSMKWCFKEAERIHFGPQTAVVKGTVALDGTAGVLKDGSVVETSLHDAASHACFLGAINLARFKAAPADVGQEQTFHFQHVPQAHH